MEPTRRGLILGAGIATVATHLVKAEASDLLSVPWNMKAAKQWAKGQFSDKPGVRVVYSNGDTTKWHYYPGLRREQRAPGGAATYLVAIEVCVTDAEGRRAINTVPVDGIGVYNMQRQAQAAAVQKNLRRLLTV